MKKQSQTTQTSTTKAGNDHFQILKERLTEINAILAQDAPKRDLNRIEAFFIELTGKPTPQGLLSLL